MEHHDYERAGKLRDQYIPYEDIENMVNPKDGDILVDFGSGDGFYSLKFAPLVGSGKIYAYELNNRGIDAIRKKLADRGIGNVEIVEKDICYAPLPERFNKAFFSNVFHDLDCQDTLLFRFSGVKNLEITFIEFKIDTPFGPPENIRFSQQKLREKLETHGFVLDSEIEFEYHYAHRYKRKSN
ncbi:MAG: class I SAM-dependent methyltransferase [Thermoplasmataceae archaeon]